MTTRLVGPALLVIATGAAASQREDRPNILLVVADDLNRIAEGPSTRSAWNALDNILCDT